VEARELAGLNWVDDEPDPALERWRNRRRLTRCLFCGHRLNGKRCFSAMAILRNRGRVGFRQHHRCTTCDQPGHNSRTCTR
jgi:hypothetical protein